MLIGLLGNLIPRPTVKVVRLSELPEGGDIAEWLTEQRHITLSNPGQNEVAYRAHAEIYQAIASRDPAKSEQVMRAHLDQVSDMYWRSVGGAS